MNLLANSGLNLTLLLITIVWVLPWKIYAVWLSAKHGHKGWFVVLLIINTFAILEIIYIFFVLKKKLPEVVNAFLKALKIKK